MDEFKPTPKTHSMYNFVAGQARLTAQSLFPFKFYLQIKCDDGNSPSLHFSLGIPGILLSFNIGKGNHPFQKQHTSHLRDLFFCGLHLDVEG